MPVGGLPRQFLHARDPLGVAVGCQPDLHATKGRLRRDEVRAHPRRRSRPDGRRDRAGRCRFGPARVAARSVPGRRREGLWRRSSRASAGSGGDVDGDARAHRAGRRSRRRRPDDRGDHRGRRGKEELFRRADQLLPDGGDPRLEHELDPDHLARRGDRPAGARDRDALLQPGADAEARRGDPRGADLGRDRRGDRRARARARQGAGGGATTSRASSPTGS